MQRWTIILTAAAVGLWMIVQFARDFVANDPIGYFTGKPGHLLPVAVVALGSGAAAYLYSRCNAGAQREIRLWSWGVVALIVSAFDIFFLLEIARAVSMHGSIGIGLREQFLLAFVLIVFVSIAVYLWWEFSRTWKKKA
jgi:uncharacterized membrane protein YedE/YeeE